MIVEFNCYFRGVGSILSIWVYGREGNRKSRKLFLFVNMAAKHKDEHRYYF